jgi:hypothetical protein
MLRRIVSGFAIAAAMVLVFALPASAQQRIALVIGNAAYAKGPLKTSLADGGLVAEALTSIGFEIVEGADVNQTDLRRVFREFLSKVEAAGPGAIAFVYYSGYGIEFEGENYLIPVDARLDRDSDIPIDAVRLFDLLRPLADTPAAAKVVVLDATRPLPFRIQGGKLARGLGAIASPPGMLVGFSSAPGTTAADGPGPYGAYATAIAEMVREPGLDLETMFARIRVRTHQATNGKQTPWNVSQEINPQLVLVPAAPAATSGAPPPARVVRRQQRPMRDIGAEEAYALAIEDDNLEGYTEFVRTYPSSPYAKRVWGIIRERREALAWRRALLINSPEAYWTYLARYPDGMYAFDAERRLRRLSAGARPPSGFRMMEFEDVPEALAGEPARLYDYDDDAPPPPQFLGAPPAFIVGLPPPSGPRGPGLWRRQNNAFPVIIAPPGPRPGFAPPGGPQGVINPGGIPFQRKGPVIVNQPPPGFQGPPQNWQRPGSGIPGSPGGPQIQRGPVIVNQPPPGPPPGGPQPGFRGPPPGWQKQGTGIPGSPGGPPPGGPQFHKKGPVIVNQPPPGPPPGGPPQGFRGPPQNWQKPGSGIPGSPGGPPPQQQLRQVPQQQQLRQVPQVQQPVAPRAPVVTAPQAPRPGFSGPPPGGARPGAGIPPAAPQGQRKCTIVNGQPVCK